MADRGDTGSSDEDESHLEPTKIRRKYKCSFCHPSLFITINPREFLRHRRNLHGHKLKIVKCPHCVYACQYRQKLTRHLKLAHKDKPANQINNPRCHRGLANNHQRQRVSQAHPTDDISTISCRQQQDQQQLQQFNNYMLYYEILAYASRLKQFGGPDDQPIDLSFSKYRLASSH